MNKTRIEWCDYTINPVKGLCPMACFYCYARRMYKRFKWYEGIEWDESCLYAIRKIKKPSRIFVGSTMELFGEWVHKWAMESIFSYVKDYPQHTFIFLTKQPQNLIKWSPFPRNCWMGVSPITNGQLLLAIGQLQRVQAKVKFLSIEPMLNELDAFKFAVKDKCLDWVIIGQKTPPSKKTSPKMEWVKELVESCDKANVPVFLKNNLMNMFVYNQQSIMLPYWALNKDGAGGLRQEFPVDIPNPKMV